MKLKFYFLGILTALISISGHSQDAHFSQFYAAGLYLNPSLAGTESGVMFGSNYRTQWRSIVIPYVTNQVSFIAPLYNKSNKKDLHVGGIGMSVYQDRAGDGNFKTLGVNINGAYNLYLSSLHTITFGLQGGFIQKSLDFSQLQWGEQFNPYIGFDATVSPTESTVISRRLYPDFGAGFFYYYKASKERSFNAYFGGSAYHINHPNESLVKSYVARLPLLYKVHGGVIIPIGSNLSLSPNVLGMMQNNVLQINSGLYVNYDINDGKNVYFPSYLSLGAWYRLEDAFIFSAGVGNKNYQIAFSYDINSSSLRYDTQGRGAYEISLQIRKIKKRPSIKRFNTPRI